MKKLLLILLSLWVIVCPAQTKKPGKTGSETLLPNGWKLTPAGRNIPLGDLPLNMAVSASKKWIAVTNNGYGTQTLQLINPWTEKQAHWIEIPKSWYGLKFSGNDKYLYASGGNDNRILKYAVINNWLKL